MNNIKFKEIVIKLLYYFSFFSVLGAFIIGAILEDKGKNINVDIFMPAICIYGLFMVFITQYLAEKWGSVKGGYYTAKGAVIDFSTSINSKIGKAKCKNEKIYTYEQLVKQFDSSSYECMTIKDSRLYYKNVKGCINSYLIIKLNDLSEDSLNNYIENTKEKLETISNNLDILSFNLMLIVITNDKEYNINRYLSNVRIEKINDFDIIIIYSFIKKGEFKSLNYINGPMKPNYGLCIKEFNRIIK